MKIAVVGATGLVGGVILKVLEERNFPFESLIPAASENSIGKSVMCKGQTYPIVSLDECIRLKPDVAIFSAGGSVSKLWAPRFAKIGCFVIDNSSAWRMEPGIPLVVPEINAKLLNERSLIISNPNCSTIQMVLVLSQLHFKYKIKRLVVSTYQSVTGTGAKAVLQLMEERNNQPVNRIYPHQIDLNLFPHGGDFQEDGYTSEEIKLVNETRKILNDSEIQVTATVVRVPVVGGHSEAVNVEFFNDYNLVDVIEILRQTSGVVVLDQPSADIYPMPILAEGKNEVFVGRIRRDFSNPASLNLWIVADNLRKGAATNAVQIAEYLLSNKMI
jgi:aspartate-semialdehyde dehydrogenase